MEENKFEKHVRQKMDELRMEPSNSVWEHVKVRIGKKENRKSGLLILLLFLALLVPAGYWLYHSSYSKPVNTIVNNQRAPKNEAGKVEAIQAEEKGKQDVAVKEKDKTDDNSILKKESNNDDGAYADAESQNMAVKKANVVHAKKFSEKTHKNLVITQSTPEVEELNQSKPALPFKDKSDLTDNEKAGNVSDETKNNEPVTADNLATLSNDTSATTVLAKIKIQQTDTTTNKKAKVITKSATRNWHVGFVVSAGITHIGNQFPGLGQIFGSGEDKAFDFLAPQSNNTGGNITYYSPTAVKNRGGFIAGVFIEKSISPKTQISFGINYKDLQATHIVGQRNDTTGLYMSSRAYNDQHTYSNHFKFLELPVQLKLQLNEGKKLPLVWSVGAGLSQMISSNALQFNPYSGSYYKDNSLFNKTQIGLNTSFSAAVYQGNKFSLLFGPYVSYQVTRLADEGLYTKKHFSFFGLQSQIIFRKK